MGGKRANLLNQCLQRGLKPAHLFIHYRFLLRRLLTNFQSSGIKKNGVLKLGAPCDISPVVFSNALK